MESASEPSLPWLVWSPGDRVVVRYRADDGIHDALGTLLETNPHYVVIKARRGVVRVDASAMVTGRLVAKSRPVDTTKPDRDASAQQF